MIELLIARAWPRLARRCVRVPYLGPVQVAVLISAALGVTLAAVWFGTSSFSWSWVLQDLLGISFVLHVRRDRNSHSPIHVPRPPSMQQKQKLVLHRCGPGLSSSDYLPVGGVSSQCSQTLRTLRIPNMKVACVLLPLVLCYDVFWVFIQPHLSNSPSVMIIAATGGGSTESVPMVLRLPHINDPLGGCEWQPCTHANP